MIDTQAGSDRLVETLLTAAAQLQIETGIARETIAQALFLGCGIPYRVLGLDQPVSTGASEQPSSAVPMTKRIGLIGAGTMSQGIARAALRAGLEVRIVTRDPRRSRAVQQVIASQMDGPDTQLRAGITPDTFDGVDLIIEAISEDLDTKQRVLAGMEDIIPRDAVLATTTSSLAVHDIASALKNPNKLLGLHFFNPADRNPLVELVAAGSTEAQTARAVQFCAQLDKHVIRVPDTPGFVVNRVLIPYLNRVFTLAADDARLRDIDLDVRRRYRMPVGPARLSGIIGADVVLAIQSTLFDRLAASNLKPAATLEALVRRGVLGSKTGHIFPAALTVGD